MEVEHSQRYKTYFKTLNKRRDKVKKKQCENKYIGMYYVCT